MLHIAPSQALNARAILEYASSIEPRNSSAVRPGYGTVVNNELRKLSDAYGIAFVATSKSSRFRPPTRYPSKICAAQPDAIHVVVGVTEFRSAV